MNERMHHYTGVSCRPVVNTNTIDDDVYALLLCVRACVRVAGWLLPRNVVDGHHPLVGAVCLCVAHVPPEENLSIHPSNHLQPCQSVRQSTRMHHRSGVRCVSTASSAIHPSQPASQSVMTAGQEILSFTQKRSHGTRATIDSSLSLSLSLTHTHTHRRKKW
eukprot:GHVU01050669.1.p2 GENE.GHVU01050669.1~~GHVU01050669.1.p2  ORF type:complete len:162 (-),score=8.80 GHVU01050669.1:49-534(-)